MRILQQRIDDLSKQLKQIQDEQAKTAKTVAANDKAWNTFIKGFFGTLDVSIDATTKGMSDFVAYPYTSLGVNGGPPYQQGAAKNGGAHPYGNVGWMPMMSSNGSNVGYRGSHKIGNSNVDFIYQVSTAIDMAAAPGLANTWTKSSNTVQGAIGLGDTWIGLRGKGWGDVKVHDGVASLSGYVWTTDAIYEARRLAGSVTGVTRVVTSGLELERNGRDTGGPTR